MSNTLTKEEKIAFLEKWAPFAMEHQIKYGIPASLTLSQMMHESSCGTSNLCKKSNNYFGIKITYEGTPGVDFVYAHDDKPGEKFKIYNSAEDSMQGHSRMLTGDLYKPHCGKLSATDINGWITGIKKVGYATDPRYSKSLHEWIEAYNLTKYDTMAVQMANQRGLSCGYKKNDKDDLQKVTYPPGMSVQSMAQNSGKKLEHIEGNWHMPLAGNMVLTSDLGTPRANYNNSGTHKHQGIDMRASKGTPLYATEDNGIVTVANDIDKSGTGKHIVIKYNRPDGKSYEVTCMHLDSISVKEGDTVKAGQIIGKTGNTGGTEKRKMDEHLHFEVREGGEKPREGKIIDPKEYLAEIAVRGNLDTTLKKGEQDMLLAHKREFQLTQNENENFLADNKKKGIDWMSMLANGAGGDICGTLLSLLITASFDLMAKEEMYLAEKRKNNKETEISEKDMAQYKSDGVRVDDARMNASTTYDSIINNQESQSQTQRRGIV